jgi:glucose-1-phosphate thymidylyltransferase
MKVIIPAAGVGTRLRPLTHTVPKALLYVAGKPILGHIIQSVPSGLGELVIIIGYMADRVKEYVDQHCDSPKRYVLQEERLGLGHAVWLALREADEEEALILLGDTIIETDFSAVLSSPTTTIGVREVEDPRRFGVVEMEGGYVKRIVEKPSDPKSNLIIAGAYYVKNAKLLRQCLEELIHNRITTRGEYQLTDALERMLERGERISVFNIDVWLDCGKPETLLATNRHLLKKSQTAQSPKNCITVPPVYIAESAKITGSIIGPYVSVGDRAVVSRSIIKDSIINEDAQVKDALLSKSIVGSSSVVKGSFMKMNLGDYSELLP